MKSMREIEEEYIKKIKKYKYYRNRLGADESTRRVLVNLVTLAWVLDKDYKEDIK